MNNTGRKNRVSNKIRSTAVRPRLLVYRTNSQIYASVVDDEGKVLACASSLKTTGLKPLQAAEKVGQELASAAIKNKVSEVVFDRRGYKYHGRVAALAAAARAAGLKF